MKAEHTVSGVLRDKESRKKLRKQMEKGNKAGVGLTNVRDAEGRAIWSRHRNEALPIR